MSAVSPREKNMLLVTVVIVLYGFAALSFKKQVANWKSARRIYDTAQKKVQEEKALIAARDDWFARYEQVRELMPVFPYEKDVDTHWLNIMDSVATRNGLAIARRQTSKELEVGDVYELPIDCKDWEGTLESLVKFLYDLNKEGAMLDVRQLFVRPSNKPGLLKGSFALYCAYMRGDVEKAEPKSQKSDPGDPAVGGPEDPSEKAAEPPSADLPAVDPGLANLPAVEPQAETALPTEMAEPVPAVEPQAETAPPTERAEPVPAPAP